MIFKDNYKMKKKYNSSNLYVGNLAYISSEYSEYGPEIITTEQKYIFEKIKKRNNVRYKEVFTGAILDIDSNHFDIPYVTNIRLLNKIVNVDEVISNYSFLLLIEEINNKKIKILKK